VYLVSKHGNILKGTENTEIDNFTVLDVHRPATSISIEEILVEKVVEFHKNFCSIANPEGSIFGKNENTSTLNTVRTYIRTYNTITEKIKSKEANKRECVSQIDASVSDSNKIDDKIKSNLNDEDIYFNSPLRKTKENEEEIERHRKARKKSGRAYNDYENENENDVDEVEDGTYSKIQDSLNIQISMPFFLLSISAVGVLSFLVGKSSKFR
jgi:Xaa-Pro aminopeptidase